MTRSVARPLRQLSFLSTTIREHKTLCIRRTRTQTRVMLHVFRVTPPNTQSPNIIGGGRITCSAVHHWLTGPAHMDSITRLSTGQHYVTPVHVKPGSQLDVVIRHSVELYITCCAALIGC